MTVPQTIDEVLKGSPYRDYLYSYPHKTAFRSLSPARSLADLWQRQDRGGLFLYIHIPFCEMRCGFCNLFTTPKPGADPVEQYVAALERQAAVVKRALGDSSFSRLAIGGGTPTYLDPAQLHRVFDVAESLGVSLADAPIWIETSPETGSPERLKVLRQRGTKRVSIGVQSFIDAEVKSVGRAQNVAQVEATLDTIRTLGFETLNIDLMYGIAGQTKDSWFASLDRACDFGAEEIYLYPLYVRPLTGLGRQDRSWDDSRLALYRSGRDRLLARGYRQVSMRMFRSADAGDNVAPIEYVCQRDGMVGLGVGARSYTDQVHYSSAYAVANSSVKSIIAGYIDATDAEHAVADHGIDLAPDDQRRRYLILSLLAAAGLNVRDYRKQFGGDAVADYPALGELEAAKLATRRGDALTLTAKGFELSDAIGPWLRSSRVNQRMTEYKDR